MGQCDRERHEDRAVSLREEVLTCALLGFVLFDVSEDRRRGVGTTYLPGDTEKIVFLMTAVRLIRGSLIEKSFAGFVR
jgi:hypothetical protein